MTGSPSRATTASRLRPAAGRTQYRAFYQHYRQIGPTLSDQLVRLLPHAGQPEIRPTASGESLSVQQLPEDISAHLALQEGQVVEKAADLIKNPLVLEFLDPEERPAYFEGFSSRAREDHGQAQDRTGT